MKLPLFVCVAIITVLTAFAGDAGAQAPDCSGYPQPRYWMSNQSWWVTGPTPRNTLAASHAHVEGCIPEGQRMSGIQPFDLTLIAFRLAGVKWKTVTISVLGERYRVTRNVGWTIPSDDMEQRTERGILFDTSQLSHGWKVLNIRGLLAHPDGILTISTQYTVEIDNGGTDGTRKRFTSGKGWLKERFVEDKGFPTAGIATVDFDAAQRGVSGVWKPLIRFQNEYGPIGASFVSIDPDFHMDDPGIVIHELQYDPPVSGANVVVPIDTSLLSPGWHRLFIRSSEDSATNPLDPVDPDPDPDGTSLAVLTVWFLVLRP